MDVKELGVSVTAIGVAVTLLTQLLKVIFQRADWLPTLSSGATATIAYLLAVGLMALAASAGLDPFEQEGITNAVLTLLSGLGAGVVSTVAYEIPRAAINPREPSG